MTAEGRRIYLDTSAYLCLILSETGSDVLVKQTAGAALLSSVLLVLEARRNVIRLARTGTMSADDCQVCLQRIEHDMAEFALRDLTLDLCESTPLPAIATPRSLDLAHLRTALWFHREARIARFVTTDSAQEEAAKELGLPV